MWRLMVLAWLLSAVAVRAQPILDAPSVPGVDAAGRASYAEWLLTNTPRVFAIGANGRTGWYSGGKTLEEARGRAMQLCIDHGGTECRAYAEDLSVLWPGHAWQPGAVPGALLDTINYAFVPDEHFLWHGPAAARGVVVWSHGVGGRDVDSRGHQPPPLLRAFNDSGFDVVRFDRAPLVDNPVRAAGWLRDELGVLRRSGYRVVVAAGQSRGAWTSLQMLDTAGLADAVIALSPAAHGSGGSTNLTAQDDDLRALIADAKPARTRVAIAQFTADPFMADAGERAGLFHRLEGRVGALLLIDRPPGFTGHFGGTSATFSRTFGPCFLRFATAQEPRSAVNCPDAPEAR